MHSLMRLAAIALAALVIGCDEMPAAPSEAAPSPSGSATAGASAPVDVEATGKAYLDAARKHAETCTCSSDPFEGIIRDVCKVIGPEVDAVQAARAAVDARLAAGGVIEPEASAFLREAQLHATWLAENLAYLKTTPLKLSDDTRILRGGVYSYQRLARLWNAWHPKEPVSGIAYQSYWPGGVKEAEHPLWVAISAARWFTDDPDSMKTGGKGKPRYLPWIECVDGPCLLGY